MNCERESVKLIISPFSSFAAMSGAVPEIARWTKGSTKAFRILRADRKRWER